MDVCRDSYRFFLGLIYETYNGMVKLVEGLLLLGYKSALSSLLPIFLG